MTWKQARGSTAELRHDDRKNRNAHREPWNRDDQWLLARRAEGPGAPQDWTGPLSGLDTATSNDAAPARDSADAQMPDRPGDGSAGSDTFAGPDSGTSGVATCPSPPFPS